MKGFKGSRIREFKGSRIQGVEATKVLGVSEIKKDMYAANAECRLKKNNCLSTVFSRQTKKCLN